jgi:hypothetical protein
MSRPPKARGELVEIQFLLEAAGRGLVVAKPWGDNLPFDFLVGRGTRYHRVQVRSTQNRKHRGYQLATMHGRNRAYTVDEADFFAAYVIPEKTWYLIPVKAFSPKKGFVLFPRQSRSHGQFEGFREAWQLLEP